MGDFHFIDDPTALQIIATILNMAGPNFNAPYDSSAQPTDGVAKSDESLTQYNCPGGTTIRSMSNPASTPTMGWVISSLLTSLGPVISAYGLLLPILGVIRGIIEILCCLMNPFCVIPAVIRLFTKWIPPFISLFPPIAGAVIIASTIKLILAMVYFILTEIVPTIQLVIKNIRMVVEAFSSGNEAKANAGKQKLAALLIDFLNRIGILSVAKPLLDLVFLILGLVSGFPCGSGKTSSKKLPVMTQGTPSFDQTIEDTSCCNNSQCPPEIANPPSGRAVLTPTFFGDAPPLWCWQLVPITGHSNIKKLRPYLQDLKSQLNPQLDEPIDEAVPVGSKYDAAHFRLRILGRRGQKYCVTSTTPTEPIGSIVVPIASITSKGKVLVNNVNLTSYRGIVDYCIEPNYEQLVGRNIIAVGCHPDVLRVKNNIQQRFDNLEISGLSKYPELGDIPEIYTDMSDKLNNNLKRVQSLVEDPSLDDIPIIEELGDEMVNLLFAVVGKMTDRLNILLSRITDKITSTFEVDKHIVKAGGIDKALIQIVPREAGGVAVAQNLPTGSDISVEIFTDFGTLQNQYRDNNTGMITAELISPFPGIANITAKVNTDFITNFDGENESIKTERVKFVADAIMPKRRTISRPSHNRKVSSGIINEREPGNR
jgi:hypothetical protein